jgi:hypothetical protein
MRGSPNQGIGVQAPCTHNGVCLFHPASVTLLPLCGLYPPRLVVLQHGQRAAQ